MEQSWFDNPKELTRKDRVFNFWPRREQTPEERINSATRFIIYAACITYVIRRDIRVFILALMVISVLFVLYKNGMIDNTVAHPVFSTSTDYTPDCQEPTFDNPMANVLISDIADRPNRPPACYYPTVKEGVKEYLDDTIPYDCGRSRCPMPEYQRKSASRQFVSMPVSTVPGAQTEFAEWCYGKKFAPICRSDPSMCSPNARGAQLESFRGLASNNDLR